MKVVLSRRFDAEFDRRLRESLAKFGPRVASETFQKIDTALRVTLASNPKIGHFLPARKLYRYGIRQTPFVIYYRIQADWLVAVAIRHGAQSRAEFESD